MRTRRIRLSVSLGWSAAAVAVAVLAAMPAVWTTRAEAARPERSPGRQMQPVPDDVQLLKDVAYGKGGGRPLTLDILRPKKLPATSRRSCKPVATALRLPIGAKMER